MTHRFKRTFSDDDLKRWLHPDFGTLAFKNEVERCYALLEKAEKMAELASIAGQVKGTTTHQAIENKAREFLEELEK